MRKIDINVPSKFPIPFFLFHLSSTFPYSLATLPFPLFLPSSRLSKTSLINIRPIVLCITHITSESREKFVRIAYTLYASEMEWMAWACGMVFY